MLIKAIVFGAIMIVGSYDYNRRRKEQNASQREHLGIIIAFGTGVLTILVSAIAAATTTLNK